MLRLHHYFIRTERPYVDWIVRHVRFHAVRSCEDPLPAELKIESFLTEVAVHGNVAAATQNQAMNALEFLYKRVLNHALRGSINAVRADKKINVPFVMTREEVAAVISLMQGTAQLVAKLLYGSGLRIWEAVRLRVKDIDFQTKQLTVYLGKGDKDRFTGFPATLTPLLRNHLAGVRRCISRIWPRGMARSTSRISGSEVPECRQGVGLVVYRGRPEPLRGPSFWRHTLPPC